MVAIAAFATGSRIFSPGPLNAESNGRTLNGAASHADLKCSECHAPFWGDERSSDRCLACHTEIGPEFDQPATLHGSFDDPLACRSCHPEHRGLAASLTTYQPENYPHAEFGFFLIAHLVHRDGSAFECQGCHVDTLRSFSISTCADCHMELEPDATAQHVFDFGLECLHCHDGIDSYGSDFDHQLTTYPLTGAHPTTSCGGCHGGASTIAELQSAPTDCAGCHSGDDPHQGQFTDDCAACHSTETWAESTVDHDLVGFSLVGAHGETECLDCHIDAQWSGIPLDCAGCHAQDDVHRGKLGTDCATCHTAFDWGQILDVNFDHVLTGYRLTGRHAQISECESCHAGGQFVDTPTSCVACHAADDAHDGAYGKDCDTCHNTSGWGDATFDHDRSGFRLTGAHRDARCESCHAGGKYAGTPSDCVACHAQDDVHAGSFGSDCAGCHTTSKWSDAALDHNATKFPLTGRHTQTACEKCHVSGVYAGTPTRCVDCHVEDDAHSGLYGWECGDCHTTEKWGGVTIDHTGLTDCLACHGDDDPPDHYAGQCSACHTSTTTWTSITFSHVGLADCAGCHSDDAPPDHYAGQCSDCHTSTSNWSSVTFNHAGLTDCADCHSDDAPPNHYSGQCSDCHDTSGWGGAGFDHSGQTDCLACHSDEAPGNHYSGQCSACHSTSQWKPIEGYSHSSGNFPSGHRSDVKCRDCHAANNDAVSWGWPEYIPDCAGCHAGDFKDGPHKGATVSELRNCGGACHKPAGKHDPADGEW